MNIFSRSQRQARAAINTYRWIEGLTHDRPVDESLIKEIHGRMVTGCDDDHCPPGQLRGDGHNVSFGRSPFERRPLDRPVIQVEAIHIDPRSHLHPQEKQGPPRGAAPEPTARCRRVTRQNLAPPEPHFKRGSGTIFHPGSAHAKDLPATVQACAGVFFFQVAGASSPVRRLAGPVCVACEGKTVARAVQHTAGPWHGNAAAHAAEIHRGPHRPECLEEPSHRWKRENATAERALAPRLVRWALKLPQVTAVCRIFPRTPRV